MMQKCKNCKNSFYRSPYSKKLGWGMYCSHKCHGISRRTHTFVKCKVCEKLFKVVPSEIKKGLGKYCSRKCAGKGLHETASMTLKCLICKKVFNILRSAYRRDKGKGKGKRKRKYCSSKCNGIAQRMKINRTCNHCKKTFQEVFSVIKIGRGKFCSRKCYGLASRKGHVDEQGYVKITIDGGQIVREHRWVMERMLGRKLRKGETVHHGPGGRADNRPENLSLRAPGKHPKGWSPQEMKDYLLTVPRSLGGLK